MTRQAFLTSFRRFAAQASLAMLVASVLPAQDCGDVNGDERVDVADATYLLGWRFLGNEAPVCPSLDCADLDSDGRVTVGDAVRLLNWLFRGGPAPDCPGCEDSASLEIPGFRFAGLNDQCFEEYVHDESGIVFVRLPAGSFEMGSPDSECDREDDEGPVHTVELDSFLIGKFEVSQGQWHDVMGARPSYFQFRRVPKSVNLDDLPVEQVSWPDCQEFCRRLGLSLPTEAQWEYAARAGTAEPFAFGDSLSTEQANFNGDFPYCEDPRGHFRGRTVVIDSFEPNGFGLHNLHGNVYEWTQDVYDAEFFASDDAGERNPVATSGSDRRVAKGGCFFNHAVLCRSAERGSVLPSTRISHVGFRVAATFPAPDSVDDE